MSITLIQEIALNDPFRQIYNRYELTKLAKIHFYNTDGAIILRSTILSIYKTAFHSLLNKSHLFLTGGRVTVEGRNSCGFLRTMWRRSVHQQPSRTEQ